MSEYDAIVVDDELHALQGLEALPWQQHGFQLVASFQDAESALAWIKHHPVHLIIADIRMPEMSGLEMAKHVQDLFPEVAMVLLSGHSEFAFAQKALKYGVMRYLLKPIDDDEFANMLNDAYERLQQHQRRERWTRKIVRDYWFRDHLRNPLEEEDFQTLESAYIPQEPRGAYRLCIVSASDDPNHDPEIGPLLYHSVYLRDQEWAWVVEGRNVDPVLERATRLVRYVGVSAEHGELGELRQALQEARKSQDYWYFLSNQQLLFYEDVPQADQEQLHRLSQQVSRLSQRTAELEISSDLHEVEEFFAAIRQSGVSARFARHLVFTLAVSIQQLSVRWLSFEVQDSLWKHWGDPLVLVEESERFEALEECVLPLLREIVSTVVETRKARERDERISRVLQYIDTHYHEMISLDDVAEVAQMHPSVFSTWFKRSIGQNYIDYLTNTRIEAAKRLLSGSERYVKEVSSRVGFQDSRYFGQVFKRMTGITPKEYQEMHGVPHARSRN